MSAGLAVRDALRLLAGTPLSTLVVIVTLAAAIAPTITVFGLVDVVLLRTLPYPDPDRLFIVRPRLDESSARGLVSGPGFDRWRNSTVALEALAGFRYTSAVLGTGAERVTVRGADVSPALFPMLGVVPARGRLFTRADESGGQGPVILLNERQARLTNADVGSTVTIDGLPCVVIGLLPEAFAFPGPDVVFWAPLDPRPAFSTTADGRPTVSIASFEVMVRSRPGASAAAMIREAAHAMPDLQGVELVPLRDHLTRGMPGVLLVFQVAVVLALLAACANVSNLILARQAAREGERAVRLALGATRKALIATAAVEGGIVAVSAGALGYAAALALVSGLRNWPVAGLPQLVNLQLNGVTVGAVLTLAVLAGFLSATLPGFRGEAATLRLLQASDSRTLTRRGRGMLSRWAVAAQLGAAFVLVATATALVAGIVRIVTAPAPFDPRGVTLVDLSLPPTYFPTWHERSTAASRIVDALLGSGTVETAAVADTLPFADGLRAGELRGDTESRASTLVEQGVRTRLLIVGPGFFEVLKLRPLGGRTFDRRDQPGATPAAIVTESLARRRFGSGDPLGRTVDYQRRSWYIVGVVPDLQTSVLDASSVPTLFLPYTQFGYPEGYWDRFLRTPTLLLRSRTDRGLSIQHVRSLVDSMGGGAFVSAVEPLTTRIVKAVGPVRLYARAMAVTGGFALLLAVSGVGALVTHSVVRRVREFGVRLALGATPARIFGRVLAEAFGMLLVAVAAGIPLALAFNRVARAALYGTPPIDAVGIAAAALVLTVAVLVAAGFPALRAARTDPGVALRVE